MAELKAAERRDINARLSAVTYFPSRGEALGVVSQALAAHGLGFSGVGVAMSGPEGRATFPLHRSNAPGTDPFLPPEDIENSVVVFAWYEMPSSRFEVTAYVS